MRLCQALAESSHRLQLPAADLPTFRYLEAFFPHRVEALTAGTPRLSGLHLDHQTPRTAVGELARPLIFPHAFFDHLRARWQDDRPLHFAFSGLCPPGRRQSLRRWFEQNREALAPPRPRGPLGRLLHRSRERLAGRRLLWPEAAADPRLSLVASRRGRRFPVKAWDADYHAELCRTRFVLCPDGDFVWTYRFFEAIACGALPVVEHDCEHYAGFEYATLDTPVDELARPASVLEHNLALLRERLSVPREALDAAIEAGLG